MSPIAAAPSAAAPSPCGPDAQTVHVLRTVVCTHGDDTQFAPGSTVVAADEMDAADVLVAPYRGGTYSAAVRAMGIPCGGNGTAGNRIRAYYVYAQGAANHLSRVRRQLVADLEQANYIVAASAHATGGRRYLRLYTDSHCTPTITPVAIPSADLRSYSREVNYLSAHGLDATDRKYVLYTDARQVCGLGSISVDAQPGPFNASNEGPSWARIDRPCWSGTVTAHEIFHTLGAVQKGAPHYDGTGHCTDDRDLMCYNAGGKRPYLRCHSSVGDDRADCGGDDYFTTSPRAHSWLSAHWNTAFSSFLYGGGPARPAAPTTPALSVRMTTPTTVLVTWRAARGSVVTAYRLFSPTSGMDVHTTRTSWTVSNTAAGQEFEILASNPSGSSRWSAPVTANLPLPPAPSTVSVAGRTVSWQAAASPFTTGFSVFGVSADGTSRKLATLAPSATSYDDTGFFGLFGQTWADYRVCATDDAGGSCRSAAA